jgi:hypothetical protein
LNEDDLSFEGTPGTRKREFLLLGIAIRVVLRGRVCRQWPASPVETGAIRNVPAKRIRLATLQSDMTVLDDF